MECWKPVMGYEGIYEVSDLGSVRSLPRKTLTKRGTWTTVRGGVLQPVYQTSGHKAVTLYLNGVSKRRLIHHLVLESFIEPRPEGLIGLHNNDDKENNTLLNLRWGTYSDNSQDAVKNRVHHEALKTHCPRGHKLEGLNLKPGSLKSGRRDCKACSRERESARQQGREFSGERADIHYANVMAGLVKPVANQYTVGKEGI